MANNILDEINESDRADLNLHRTRRFMASDPNWRDNNMTTIEPSQTSLTTMANFMIDNKFTDVEIRCEDYVFRAHKAMLAASSRYFEKCLTGDWQEAQDGIVHIAGQSPVLIARMLEWIYFGKVNAFQPGGTLEHILANAGSSGVETRSRSVSPALADEVNEKVFITQVKMYVFADQFDMFDLQGSCLSWFNQEIVSPGFTLNHLVDAIEFIYTVETGFDQPLKKMPVFLAQMGAKHLLKMERYLDLIDANSAFALDLTTKYAARNVVFCPDCVLYTDLRKCKCGFNGICGQDKLCTDQNWEALKCSCCGHVGGLLRDDQDEVPPIDDVGHLSLCEVAGLSVKTPPPTQMKKRKSSG